MFEFNDFLRKLGFRPERVRLLRHDHGARAAWQTGGRRSLGCYASFQTRQPSPYAETDIACHFLPETVPDGVGHAALFVGITRITDRWDWDGERLPAIVDEEIVSLVRNDPGTGLEVFDLEWLSDGSEYVERMLIGWGLGARAWSQWASGQPKDILELRRHATEPDFPGFRTFISRIGDIPGFPPSWVGALRGVGGIYLLVTDTGEQYVGSATGTDGFIGRWRDYLADGHGGNLLLRAQGHRDYTVSILEIASPDMAESDILDRESFWKRKLGTRAHGLNAN
ncbi:MAG: GIY-YIG nuclease family protein [Rhodobacteraceae bacterium]|nr:GIY-YIG nuclease family protein [Paracoccaceae bacterium]MCY4197122.1 GIY-YIG nuclease family protein [Paracoccaceae bacterium]MCY4326920.1 GIY-YIG nuclease family protein [Paracoccaceae bacterium]